MPSTHGSNLQKAQNVRDIKSIEAEQEIHENEFMAQSKNFKKAKMTVGREIGMSLTNEKMEDK